MASCRPSSSHCRASNHRRETTERMTMQMSASTRLNLGLRIFFSEFVRVSLSRPSQALFFARTVLWQGRAARRRARVAREGVHVPPHCHFLHHQWLFVTVDAQRGYGKLLQGQSFTETALFHSLEFEDEFETFVTVEIGEE